MPDDSITRNSSVFDPCALEAALVQELDFLRPEALVVLPERGHGCAVVMGVAASVYSWIEPRALCELASELVSELQPTAAISVWLLDESALDRLSLAEQLAAGTLAWSARLTAAGFEQRERARAGRASATALELCELAAELLKVPALDPAEPLFARGVDSLVCVRMISRVRERWGVELELRDVLDARQISDLASRIEQLQAEGVATFTEIPPVARDRAWPLSAAQLRMWLLSQLTEAGPAQHVTGGLRLSGALDHDALRRAAHRLTERHESLRTVIEAQDGAPLQRVLAEMPLAFRVIPGAAGDAAACVREAAEPAFDFVHGPLWRLWLYQRGPREHLLVLCMHHVISDGWSMELAARELLQLYAAEVEGAAALPALELQYLDYVAWERAQEARIAEQVAYWRARLVAEVPPLELPRTLPRKQRAARSGRAGRSVAVELDAALTSQLHALAAAHGSSLFAVLLAGFQLWLSRMTGRDQIRVGVPVLGRPRAAAESLIGCFVNTLVLCLEVEPAHDVATLVRTVDASLREALAHAEVPFETLVRELSPQRHAEHTPLFQVTYNHLRVSEPTTVAGLHVERLVREPVGSPFELSLETEELADGRVRALFNYPVETFTPETVRELAELYVGLLWQLVSGSARRVSELPLLCRAELLQLSAAHRAQPSRLPDLPVHELIVQQALRRPDACALVGAGERWSFAELEHKSRALALALRALGVGPDVPVGIYVPRGPRMIVAALGILRAGGAYVPLDMSYPAARLSFIVRDSQIEIVLCERGQVLDASSNQPAAQSGESWLAQVRCLALDALLADERAEPLPHVPVHPGQLAYVIYTSGSTGVPKGVGVGHGSLQMHLRATGALYEIDERDCALHFSSFSFDAAVENWAMTLTHGARLVISDAEAWTGAQTFEVVQREGVTIVFPPTAHLRLLAQHVLDAGAAGQILRAVCVGGEAVLREDHALIMRALGPERFINGYGPTECVITPLLWRSFAQETPEQSYAPIGRPVGERRVYVLDAELMPVPVGVVGEVYIAGGHARGYHARPGLTAESFVPDPFSDQAGGRMYRTGDLGRWLPSGDVEYVGRRDAQVKLRGFRIELGEIESCLRRFPSVSDAVVVLHENKRLLGYVEMPEPADLVALRAHVSAALPEYMVPAQLVALSALPKTPNGKVDRRALPQPEAAERSRFIGPESETERALARIWCEVLGIEAVGLDDNFFELGGDSISALQLVGRARAERVALHVRSVFEHQTLRALARASADAQPLTAAAITPQPGRVSLTPIQRLFLRLPLPNPSHFNQALLLGMRRSLDPAVLREALRTLVSRHPALRLSLRRDEPRYLAFAEVEQDHLLEICEVGSEGHALRVIQSAQRSLDLSQGQLLRAVLLREPARERLLLVVHHLASDGVSLRVLLEELVSACDSLVLDPPGVDPGRWAERLEAWSIEAQLLEQRAYWREQLRAGPLLGVAPTSDPVGACQTLSLRLDVDWTARLLREAGRPLRLRTNELLLTALVRAVQRWNGQTSLSVQLEGHGRDSRWSDLDPSRSVGWFTCVYPLALEYQPELGANLCALKERVRGVPDAGLGYGVLTELRGELERPAAPSITFNYLGQLDDSFDARRSPFELLSIEPGDSVDPAARAASPIVIDAWVAGAQLSVRWTVSPSALPLSAAEGLLALFERELYDVITQAALVAPRLTPSDLAHVRLSQAELDALPFAPGAIEHVYPTSALQQGMLYHAETEPDSSAYVNALAFELRGVTPAALERAFRAAVARHPALRSGFVWQPLPLQVVLAHAELPVRHADLTGAADLAAARAQACKFERARRFQLQDAPLARLYLGQLPDARVLVIWTSHHLALDGWSAARLLAEVLAEASGVERARAPALGHDAILAWRARYTSAHSEAFWRVQLRGLEEPCLLAPQLPEQLALARGRATALSSLDSEASSHASSTCADSSAGGGRSLVSSNQGGGEIGFRLTSAGYEQLRRCAQALHVTPNTLIQAAWLLLLERYTGRAVVSCGITVSGRPAELPGSDALIGMYINTLPLVHRIEASERVDAWLTRLMRENLALREHEHSALSDIQRWAALSGRALFDSLVVFENYPIEEALRGANPALAPAALEVFEETSVAFTLRVQQARAALDFVLAYPRARLDAPEATRLGERYLRVLEQIARQPSVRVAEIALVDAVDEAQLAELDATTHGSGTTAFVADWIAARAQAQPNATALVFAGVRRSYAELEARSTRLARRLRELGVRSDARVAVLAERSFELVESLYAVLKAGGAYVPLDPELPSERVAGMLEDTAPRVLLTQRAQLRRHPALAAFTPCLILDELDGQAGSSEPLERAQHADDLAYVIYTSGSTGKPKGAGNTQRGLANRLAWMQATFQLTRDDVVLQKTPYSFDVSVWEFFWPLMTGSTLVIAAPGDHRDPQRLAALIADQRVTTLHFVPSMLRAFLEAADPALCGSLRRVICSGEALDARTLQRSRELLPTAELHNLYGPTEAAIDVTHWPCADSATPSVPIGRPIWNTAVYVLDTALQRAPIGAIGELYLAGIQLARGYHGRPALTAERFVPDPWGHGTRMYRTGDLGRYRADGVLEYLGRTDHQIKLRGYRIELGEIEAVLREQAAVRDAVVVARHDGGHPRLVGYVASHAHVELSALHDALRARLPEYMVPAQLAVLQELPLTPSGKLDRRALPAPERSERRQRAPANALEVQLLELWRAVLSAPDAGVEDDFFELGGDSLLSLRIIARARALGLALTPRQLFEARSVAALAAQAQVGEVNAATPRVSREHWQPLSHAQERMWFLAQLDPDSAAYNISGAVRLRGALDVAQLRAAFEQLLARHEALRTSFEDHEGVGMQRVHAQAELALRTLNVRGPESEQLARDAFAEEARRPFRLSDHSLLRLLLIGLEEHEHVLVLTMHHLVSDAGTIATLLEELQALYSGQPLPAAPALQYVDYAVWQRQALSADELARQLDYFRAQLGSDHPLLALPTDRPRPAVQSYRGASLRFTLDAQTSRGVQRLGRELGASTFMVLLAAFEALLYRLTGQRDLRVGVPISRRSRVELEGVVGLFVNTLVLRTELAGAVSFRELIAQVKQVSLDAQAHGDLPFERLVEALSPERSLSHNPLFQVMFDHQRAPLSGVRKLGAQLELAPFEKNDSATQLDLSLETFGDGDQIFGNFTYATDLFDHASIAALCERFVRVLQQLVAEPTRKLAELELLAEAERAALIAHGTPQLPAAESAQPFVHVAIARVAAQQPEALALEGETDEAPWTYAQLEQRSNQWAQRLRELGVGPETKVGLCVTRSPRMVMGALAILKAGAAYVPLDPSYPLARLRMVLEDAGVQLVVGELAAPVSLQLGAAEVLLCDRDDVSGYPAEAPRVALSAHNLAYVVYTSGSTGRPKGVGVSHGALAQHVAAIGRDYGMRRDDCALHFASIGFDAGSEQWLCPLVHGARLFIRGDELWSAERALEVLRERGVTWFEMPPGYLHELARAALERGQRLQLRACSAGGEAVSRESLQTMLQAVHPAPVINGYGPTETVITPMTWHAREPAQCTTAYAPIGRVLGPRRSYVLDPDLNLVPAGVTGELYLGGSSLARGYIGRPGLSAERFVPDPFAADAGARMYRTGDLARVLPDGNVEYVGRADHQVKVRGFRVELGEIEAQLLAQPGVREAVVVADAGRLLGYVSGELQVTQLRAQLRAALPEYMVPAQLIVLAQLPRNSNGKVDRKMLPAPAAAARGYEPPRNVLEAQLCTIMAEVLQVERVGRDDDFFALGGDSIRSLQVISRARKLGLALSPRDMFRCRGAAELARAAADLPPLAAGPELQPLVRDTELFQLSYAQERLWFLAQLDPNSAAYNISGAVRVTGPLNVQALAAAVSELGARHEALRTTFEARDGLPWQRVHARARVQLELHDGCSDGPLSAEEQARVYVEAAADAPFDLAQGPLARVLALRVSDDEHVLCLVMHHIISDGWSLDTAIAELSQLYAAQRLPALPLQYVDYAAWQRARLTSAELDRQLDYWRATLGSDHPVLSLPCDHPRPQLPSQRGELVDFALGAALSGKLQAFARAHDTTVFVVLLSVFQSVLQRLSGQREVRVGVPVSNRERVEIEGVIGLFVNTQVLRSDYDPSRSFAGIVARTHETVLAARAHQDVPFERLVEALQPARSMGHNPLFQVMYNHLRRTHALFAESPELHAAPFVWKSQWSQFDLTFDSEEDADGVVSGRLTYATDLFARRSVERWAAQIVRALELLINAPEEPVGNLSWLAPEERALQLRAAAGRRALNEQGGLLHERIRQQALRHRSRIACSYDGEQLSYGALELRANQWAQRLVKLGVGPGVLVGLCVERSLELVVGVLAILKAGGAYVPLDPSAPAERVSYMIADSRLSLVLTQRALLPRFADTAELSLLCLDREDVRAEPTEPPITASTPDQLAYVIYTSGSTGKPKGALLTHRNVTRLFDVTQPSFGFDEHDVWTLFHSYAFDFSVWELFGALLYGGCVVVVPYDVSRSPSDFYALLLREGVTILNQTPSAFRQLAAVACAAPERALALRHVVFGGEALELEALRPWFERFGDQQPQLINMYGITETTVHVTHRPVCIADLQDAAASPIGEPIDDLSLYVLDEALEPCAWGVPGELYVGGPGLARGYHRRPGLTAERFVPNPFGPGRLYRSGDLALRREHGALEYLGRSDHQVKIRGFRIELGEIAAQLQAHPAVREATVIARPGPSGQRLLGYVTCHNGHGAELVDALKQHLRKALPEYMVPASLIVLEALPLTVNGKLDQARLPEPAQRTGFEPPSTESERKLAEIWRELLGVERVGKRDDFFELGGHSLLVTQVLSRVQRQFGVTLQLRGLFESSTLQGLAARIDEAGASSQGHESQLDALDALLSDLEDEA